MLLAYRLFDKSYLASYTECEDHKLFGILTNCPSTIDFWHGPLLGVWRARTA
jgi:hypothetical protein